MASAKVERPEPTVHLTMSELEAQVLYQFLYTGRWPTDGGTTGRDGSVLFNISQALSNAGVHPIR